ncbi:TonB-dependent receptor [uncultured Sphingomonas sp.]|uniref:TonB-dependent receptor n=1 Tax=uncultured Sphingomonas sp. TaxID=158754 RepID=UPI002631F500|nr:TonB-dependent receptor [uncultured Sphingomonas sp.]
MTKSTLLAASALTLAFAAPAWAQEAQPGTGTMPQDIVVTAQRQSQTLQQVPIAVSAFTAEALQKQQIDNASDLQLTLPNITFSKGNFTGSSFTIRGIGDLCVGISCDAATAIHLNGSPLLATRIFETEYFDLERVEVLRGPQGTLFGRNATSGVVNFITAKPRTDKLAASGEAEYGNYNSVRAKGMVNIPLTDTLAVRLAGFYLNRDGYTKNVYNGQKLDGRDMWAVRGSIRWEPTIDTTVEFIGNYFYEKDNRLRIQKQLCQTDPTGVLGCLNNRLDAGRVNSNATLTGVLGSVQLLSVKGIPAPGNFALGSVYGADSYTGNPILPDVRQVYTAYTPSYRTNELQLQGRVEHNFGSIKAQLTGFYHETLVDSSQDYNLGVQNRALIQPALNNLAAAAGGAYGPAVGAYLTPLAKALMPNGPTGVLCASQPVDNGMGVFGGQANCSNVPLAFDRSDQKTHDWSAEGIISSNFDGPFNFLLGGIYVHGTVRNGDYYVNAFGLDYISGLLGSFTSLGAGAPPSYLASPYFYNNTASFTLKSYGIFGETYYDVNDKLKLTIGLRYNNDKKNVASRSTLATFLTPYGQTGSAFNSPIPGVPPYNLQNVGFDRVTGRAVLDYKFSKDHLLYASYSRGYKSGGFNPPVQVPGLTVPSTFAPEQVDAFEIGSKNTFDGGRFTLNLTGFYYKYKGLQLSRIVARTSVNDNIDANIYGVEAEAFFRPAPDWSINMAASYLHTKVTTSKQFVNQRDPGGGRSDAVIIKDITNASNCAVIPNVAGNAAATNAFVTMANSLISPTLQGPTAFPADGNIKSTGAFSVCSALTSLAKGPLAGYGVQVLADGVTQSIQGNELPQAPVVKFSAGIEKTFDFSNGMSIVPRFDITYTGESYANIFNGRINRIQGYEVANAQIQLNGVADRWFLRGFIQNIFNNNATTGAYLTDQSSGLFTNIFTLEPRRYGVAAGFRF